VSNFKIQAILKPPPPSLLTPILKDDDNIQRQVIPLYCAANKLRGTLDQCSPAVKHSVSCLLHANVRLPTVEQIHTDQYEALTCCV